jgi:hypothetical protein
LPWSTCNGRMNGQASAIRVDLPSAYCSLVGTARTGPSCADYCRKVACHTWNHCLKEAFARSLSLRAHMRRALSGPRWRRASDRTNMVCSTRAVHPQTVWVCSPCRNQAAAAKQFGTSSAALRCERTSWVGRSRIQPSQSRVSARPIGSRFRACTVKVEKPASNQLFRLPRQKPNCGHCESRLRKSKN